MKRWFIAAVLVVAVLSSLVVTEAATKRTHKRAAHTKAKAKVKQAALPKFAIGKGVWIYQLPRTEKGNVKRIAKRAHDAGLDYILVKTHDGSRWQRGNSQKAVQALIKECHKVHVKFYAWGYVYGNNPVGEANRAIQALKMGADGYIFNAEVHFRHKYHAAEVEASKVRRWVNRNAPSKILGYSTFCRINKQGGIPYETFDRYSDVAMPQLYWAEFRGWTEDNAAAKMCAIWGDGTTRWGREPKPIIPTLHAYRDTGNTDLIPPKELAEVSKSLHGYLGINYYVWEKMGSSHWKVVAKAPGSVAYQKKHNQQAAWKEAVRVKHDAKVMAAKAKVAKAKAKHAKALKAKAKKAKVHHVSKKATHKAPPRHRSRHRRH